jgi:hypothetical protein
MLKAKHYLSIALVLFVSFVVSHPAEGSATGPYTEAGINGYIGSDWRHANPLGDDDSVVNPIFRGWATGYQNYLPADEEWTGGVWDDPTKALGPVTGEHFDIISLGDLDPNELQAGKPPGEITLNFGDPQDPNNLTDPNYAIRDGKGYDFVVFENGHINNYSPTGGPVEGIMFAELAYVEVSSDGTHFARFPSASLTEKPDGPYPYLAQEISNLHGLAGKHPNAYGVCTGTPFDLRVLADDVNVVSGLVDLNNIHYVRIVDIPGSGYFEDEARKLIDPNTYPDCNTYVDNHPIYDAWPTWGSGGLDLEAIGVLREQEYSADINLDGIVDLYDLELFTSTWLSHFGHERWFGRCDLAQPQDRIINMKDFAVISEQWLQVETWRSEN